MSRKRSLSLDTTHPILDVYMHGHLIGHLGQDGADVWFRYIDSVLDDPNPERWTLSIRLPVVSDTYGHAETLAFFDNLLLESDTRRELAHAVKRDERDTTGLLGRVGAECAGAVSIWPHNVLPPDVHEYEDLSSAEIEALFNDVHGSRVTRAQLESRQSMSGVQQKLVFRRTVSGTYALPIAGAPGTVIIKRSSGRYADLAANELLCLRVFRALKLTVAEAACVPNAPDLLEVTRYDRHEIGSRVERLHQEDFCQATGRLPFRKYQHAGGPGMREITEIIRRHSYNPAEDLQRLIRSTVANICIGNMDAHAKNYSLLRDEQGTVRLAPFYDIVCTEVYDGLDATLSLYFGGNDNPQRLLQKDVVRFAKELHVDTRAVYDAIDDVPQAMTAAWSGVVDDVLRETQRGDALAPLVERMQRHLDRRIPLIQSLGAGH